MSDSPPGHASDAAKVAGGSGITFAGILTDRGLRFGVAWLLSGVLGSELYGVYAFTTMAFVPLIAAFASLGLDTGVIYFGARYRKTNDLGRLKGMLQLGGVLALASSVLTGLAITTMPGWLCATPALSATSFGEAVCADPEVTTWGALIIGLWIPLLFFVGALRARKDMKRSALAFQITMPLTLIAGVAVSVGLELGLSGALMAYAIAAAATVVVAARFSWHHYGALMRDRRIASLPEPGALLAFSIPQTLAAMVFRLNLRMDYLMLYSMVDSEAVGIYAIAAGLAVLGALPVNAVITMFNPMISELVATGETARLDALLKTVTRWLIVMALPIYMVLILLPDLILRIYRPEYLASMTALVILCCGQIINVACSPTMRLIPMSGHTTLNLINGVVATALGFTLNMMLIPKMGSIGAAWATAITLSAWGLWRVVEVWHLLKCFPFTLRSIGLLLGSAAAMAAVHFTTNDASIATRIIAVSVLLTVYVVTARFFAIMPEDHEILTRVKRRISRLVGRNR
ncbi:MAG: oligosaccharide flippase family protein [Myxococcota bacterium]|nr:oligosaccharide flippase family protein [Myxococcota bacterium]